MIDLSGAPPYATAVNITFRRLGACFAEVGSIDLRHVADRATLERSHA
jgi:hypothetical protein